MRRALGVLDADAVIERVGRRIAELREKLGLTQAEAAELLEISLGNLQRIEHGFQNLTLRTLVRFANAFECDVIELLKKTRRVRRRRGRPPKAKR